MPDWSRIDTVLLDMDGTLLDLHFDNQFWLEHVPLRFAERHGLSVEQAKTELYPRFQRVEGTMAWYCVDHWTGELGLDIVALKEELRDLIAMRPRVPEVLDELRARGKRLVLVTNAHGKSLALKMRCTGLGGHLDAVICAHDLGHPKEQAPFWARLQAREPYEPYRTLMVDDSLPVLRAARRSGIAHLLAVRRPDSRRPARKIDEFPAVDSFGDLLPVMGSARESVGLGGS
jgi:putative hydrolase of the HAD superfamily